MVNINKFINKRDLYNCKSPDDLNGILRHYKSIDIHSMNEWETISDNTFINNNGGTCFDFVNFEANYIKSNFKLPCEGYFMSNDDFSIMHSFLGYEEDGDFYIFEAAMKSNWGIHTHLDGKSEILKITHNKFKQKNNCNACLIKYPVPTPYGLNLTEFLNYIKSRGKIIYRK